MSSWTTADWALFVSFAGTFIALLAVSFSGWQAIMAYRARRAANDRGLVEWDAAEWVAPEVIEIRSKGPDEARRVWGRLTVKGVAVEARARRLRAGQALRFTVPGLDVEWDLHAMLQPRPGEPSFMSNAFGWGALITWHTRFGRPGESRPDGMMRRMVREDRTPRLEDETNAPGMPI